ncbi:DUF2793 domain-containing protein [Planktotalea sp.]|uniref:DUF2793 domain-containing protein n=1 Tax=Planktotalea sp. TaxID=2029877 RepID=UPI00329849D0
MTSSTSILGLPYIQPAQAQKHVTHNEALRVLDALVQMVVLARDLTVPPVSVETGDCYLVASSAQGAWTGHDAEIAIYENGVWSFIAPLTGWQAYDTAQGVRVTFDGTDWVSDEVTTVDTLGINAVADGFDRLSVASDAVLLNHAGSNHQLKINKAAVSDTASLLFQTGFSGRAEMGLAGNDDFSFKVSADGATWFEALRIDAATGGVTFGQTAWRDVLSAPRTYFVDPLLGNDTGDGLTLGAGAFATLDHALTVVQGIDARGHAVGIQLADGTYSISSPLEISMPIVGASKLTITGNVASPDLVILDGVDEVFKVSDGTLALEGVRLQNASTADATIHVSNKGLVRLAHVDFGVAGGHIIVVENGNLALDGPYSISGGAKYHLQLLEGGVADFQSQTVTLTSVVNFSSAFVSCARCSVAQMPALTFVGTATGRRYKVWLNGVINTSNEGETYFPGDVDGVESTGGVYN